MPNDAIPLQGWEQYGLVGLFLGALVWMVFSSLRTNRKQAEEHTQLVTRIVHDSREERREMTAAHTQATNRLGDAIDRLADKLGKI